MQAPFEIIDSHCHIDDKAFDADRQEVIARAKAAGVRQMIVVGCAKNSDNLQSAPTLAETDPDLYATVGVHPHDAGNVPDSLWAELEAVAKRADIVAIGETGLDYFYNHSPKAAQTRRFAEQIDLARRLKKLVVCHVRDAHEDARSILKEGGGATSAIIHCFTGTAEEASAYAELGCYISFSGIVTFRGPKCDPIRQALPRVPADRLLIETDCPYLSPHPLRGKRNEPAFLVHTLEFIAGELGQDATTLARQTRANTARVFSLTG